MIFLPCADAGAVDVLEVVRQKGELELEGRCQQLRGTARPGVLHAGCRLTQSGLLAATRLLATSLLCYGYGPWL